MVWEFLYRSECSQRRQFTYRLSRYANEKNIQEGRGPILPRLVAVNVEYAVVDLQTHTLIQFYLIVVLPHYMSRTPHIDIIWKA